MAKVIGVLTAGGDCPGLNAVIRGVATRATEVHDAEVLGIRNGWEGLMEGRTMPLDRDAVRGILTRGGTILGTSRMDPYVHGDGYESIRPTVEELELSAVVVVGGDGLWNCHVHTNEIGASIEVALDLGGRPKTIRVTDLFEEVDEEHADKLSDFVVESIRKKVREKRRR